MYEIISDRDTLARIIASETCGIDGAEPEADDYAIADKVITFIKKEIEDNT